MALSDEGTTVSELFELRAELAKLTARMTEFEKSQELLIRDQRDLSAFVRGNRDVGAQGLASQMEHIANDVREIKARITQQDVETAQQKKLLGFIGAKDLPSIISVVSSIAALTKFMGWW